MELKKINIDKYAPFISNHFTENNKQINTSQVEHIYNINRGITYNVQYLSNKLYSSEVNKITTEFIDETLVQIVKENEITYYNYRELFSGFHFKILKSIAREEIVEKPFSGSFLRKHNLGSASSVKSATTILQNKGLLINNNGLRVAAWFFSLWLKGLL